MSVGAFNGKHLPHKEIVEGPCNSVTRILKHNSPSDKVITEVKDFAVLPGFSTDALNPASKLLWLKPLADHTEEELKLLSHDIPTFSTLYRGPRVGLTLKRFDEHKCRFWMSDYRFLIYPHLNKKQSCLIILGMLGHTHNLTVAQVQAACKLKSEATVRELKEVLDKGKAGTQKVEDFRAIEDMKNKDFALVYGVHQRLHGDAK